MFLVKARPKKVPNISKRSDRPRPKAKACLYGRSVVTLEGCEVLVASQDVPLTVGRYCRYATVHTWSDSRHGWYGISKRLRSVRRRPRRALTVGRYGRYGTSKKLRSSFQAKACPNYVAWFAVWKCSSQANACPNYDAWSAGCPSVSLTRSVSLPPTSLV